MALPLPIQRLIAKHPLGTRAATDRVLSGTLENAAVRYAGHAEHHGTDRSIWEVWLAIQRALGRDLDAALSDLRPAQRRWFAKAALAAGHLEEGVAAYEKYLAKPGNIGPFGHENVEFLEALAALNRPERLLECVDQLDLSSGDALVEQLWAARFCIAQCDFDQARKRLDPALKRHHDSGDAWAVRALLAAAEGELVKTKAYLLEAANLTIEDESLRAEVDRRLPKEWAQAVLRSDAPEDWEDSVERYFEQPPLVPSPSNEPEPHWFGGEDFTLPACQGCGHSIRQWFAFDLRAIPELNQQLPSWTLFPFLGCGDCVVWMGRHDYVVNQATLEVRLTNVAISTSEYGKAFVVTRPLPRAFAKLSRFPEEPEPARPLVGGAPYWTQQPTNVYCPECRARMTYVGAMATAAEFDPPFVINNESGFQYHFACGECSVISVIAQWT